MSTVLNVGRSLSSKLPIGRPNITKPASYVRLLLASVTDATSKSSPDSDEQDLLDHLVAEFDERGREAVEFLESARGLLDGHVEPDPIPRRANDVAYNVREALKRLLPRESDSGQWRKLSDAVVSAKQRYVAVRGLPGADEVGALDALIAALDDLEAFKNNEEGQHARRLRQLVETRTGLPPLEAARTSYVRLLSEVDTQGVHGSPSLAQARDYLERAVSAMRTMFAPFQLRRPELDALARIEEPSPEDAKRLRDICSTDHHLAYFLQHAVSHKWLHLLDTDQNPPASGGVWPALYLIERLGAIHGEEIAAWLGDRYDAEATDVSAAYVASGAVACMPASAELLIRIVREHPRSQWIRAHALRAAEALDPDGQTLERLAGALLDARDEVTLTGGAARRLIDALVTGMDPANADTRIALLCRSLAATSETPYLLLTLLPMGSIGEVAENAGRGAGVLLRGLIQMASQAMDLGLSVERILGLVDGLPEGLRARMRAWLLRQPANVPIAALVSEVAQAIRDREPTGDDVRLVDRIVAEAAPGDFDQPWGDALGPAPLPEEIGRALSAHDVPQQWRRANYWHPVLPASARRAWDTAVPLLQSDYPTASRQEYLERVARPRMGYAGSPMPQRDLEGLEAEAAARQIAAWRPGDDRMVIARELGRTLEAIAASHPQDWGARPLHVVALLRHPTYIHHYFSGLAKAGAALGGMGPQLVEAISFCRTHPWDPIPLGGDDFDYDPTWAPVDDAGVRLIAAMAEHDVDLGDRYDDAWGIVLAAAGDRERNSGIASSGRDPLETAINRACTKALEAEFHLMSAEFRRHGEIRREAFELLEEALRLEGWNGAEHRAIIAPRVPFLLHVAGDWVEDHEELLFGATAPDDLGQLTIDLALKWGRPNRWLLERHRRSVRKAALRKVENALGQILIALLWEVPSYDVDETVRWLAAQHPELMSDAGEQIARLLREDPEPAHLDLGRRFWRRVIAEACPPEAYFGFGWWAEVEALSADDFEELTLATVERSEGTLDWCAHVAERCAAEPITASSLEIISRLLRGRHEPWDRGRIAELGLEVLKTTSAHQHLQEARERLRIALTDLGSFEAQDL